MGGFTSNVNLLPHHQVSDGLAVLVECGLHVHHGQLGVDATLDTLTAEDWSDVQEAAEHGTAEEFEAEAAAAWGASWTNLPQAVKVAARVVIAQRG